MSLVQAMRFRVMRQNCKRRVLGAGLGSVLLHGALLLLVRSVEPASKQSSIIDPVAFDFVELIDGSPTPAPSSEPQDLDPTLPEAPAKEREQGGSAREGGMGRPNKAPKASAKAALPPPKEPKNQGSVKVERPPSHGGPKRSADKAPQSSLLTMRGTRTLRPKQGLGSIVHSKDALESAIASGAGSFLLDKDPAPSSSKPSKRRVGSGRSFGEYTFYPEAGGLLTYRDPQKDFIAVLMPNGDVEFETRAPAFGGLCALGVCVQVGGLRSKGERKKKHLNRVRIRFAPVPLGLGGQFGSLRGVEQRKLALMQATFEARFEMRFDAQHRLQKAALARLDEELRKIITTKPALVARKLVLARALELDVEEPLQQQKHAGLRTLEQKLIARKNDGAVAMCEKILEMIKGELAPAASKSFRQRDAKIVETHCEKLKQSNL